MHGSLASVLYGGGPGSGCHGPNCGRKGGEPEHHENFFYHGTASDLEASIREYGLIPGKAKGGDAWAEKHGFGLLLAMNGAFSRPAAVYLTPDITRAKQYAKIATEMHPGSQGVIFKVAVPPDSSAHIEPDDQDDKAIRYMGKIQPSWIKGEVVLPQRELQRIKGPLGFASSSFYAVMIANPGITADQNTPDHVEKITVQGLSVVVEYPKGSVRELKNDAGETVYKRLMRYSYGYFEHTQGRDPDEVDVILGPFADTCKSAFIVHMLDKGPDVDEREDEDKVLFGFGNAVAAKLAFFSMYPKSFFGGLTELPMATFKEKLATASLPYRRKKLTASTACARGGKCMYIMGDDTCVKCQRTSLERRARLAAGGPGSGRHPETDTLKNSTHGRSIRLGLPTIMKWVLHPEKGVVFDTDQKAQAMVHADWFKKMGLPDAGPKFDATQRGYVTVKPRDKEVVISSYSIHRPPEELVRTVRQAFPQTESYSWHGKLPLAASKEILSYGTSEGADKAWDTRGRGRKQQPVPSLRIKKAQPVVSIPPPRQETPKPAVQPVNKNMTKQERSTFFLVPCGKMKQAIADHQEQVLSQALGIPRTPNNSAFDCQSKKIGVECKTMIDSHNAKITMNKEARLRKITEARKQGLRMYTVCMDLRDQGNPRYFAASGVGSFRIGSMKEFGSLQALKGFIK